MADLNYAVYIIYSDGTGASFAQLEPGPARAIEATMRAISAHRRGMVMHAICTPGKP